MTYSHRPRRTASAIRLALALIALVGVAAPTSPAVAGTYTITGTCGLWDPYNADPAHIAVLGSCPSLVARNVGGSFSTPVNGVGGGWRFAAPSGAGISSASISYYARGWNGWQATLFEEGGIGQLGFNCPGATCPGGAELYNWRPFSFSGGYAINARMRCGAAGGCPNTALNGDVEILGSAITITDATPPGVGVSGGSLLGGWRSGSQTVAIDASDNVGIRWTRVLVDGALARQEQERACNYGLKVPCPDGGATLDVSTRGMSDGTHSVAAQALDTAGNLGGSAATTIYADNTPPTQPLDVTLDGGAGWRTENKFKLSWRNPPQSYAPIVAAEFELCPTVAPDATAASRAEAQRQCLHGSRTGAGLTKIEGLSVPKEDEWSLDLWLRDAAGNQQQASAVKVDGLDYDITPPKSVAFVAQDPADPARLRVRATEEGSGIRSGAIEVRRDGEEGWRPLPTEVSDHGLSAFMDDEMLPRGLYFLRARVADAAGLEQSSDRWEDGNPAALKLPIRLGTHLVAGRPGRRHCRRSGPHRKRVCRRRLASRPKLRVGRSARLFGRLTLNHRAMASVAVEVWRQLDGAGDWKRIGTATTSRTGRFNYKARRGPARTIRFRYPGTALIRGRNADVRLRVRASTSLGVNHRSVVTGNYVHFRGHLRGGWLPAGGVLVELQVRTRGKWRTFAQPRASGTNGRWSYQYRFETIRGRASFRFRARIRRQRGYPFTTGHSRQVRVRVRGL